MTIQTRGFGVIHNRNKLNEASSKTELKLFVTPMKAMSGTTVLMNQEAMQVSSIDKALELMKSGKMKYVNFSLMLRDPKIPAGRYDPNGVHLGEFVDLGDGDLQVRIDRMPRQITPEMIKKMKAGKGVD